MLNDRSFHRSSLLLAPPLLPLAGRLPPIDEGGISADSEVGKREIESMVLDQLLDSLPLITGRAVTEDGNASV